MAAFVALQDKLVDARAVACCPSMDLVALLTADRQLLVHRTISWQKLLHVKPAEVVFEAAALAWSPDGLRLAVGCDEGEIVLFDIEAGEQLPELRGLRRMSDALAHSSAITTMCWTDISEKATVRTPSAEQFHDRAERFLQTPTLELRSGNSVLATADSRGLIKLWWDAKVLFATIDVPSLLFGVEDEKQSRMGLHIEQVQLLPDLSKLYVWARRNFSNVDSEPDSQETTVRGMHRLVILNIEALQHARQDICSLSRSLDGCNTILDDILLASKQMTVEWKNATRIFDLKMGLMGSLYEKYACDQPPQADMLTIAATGITSPALSQFFAQDIQEMSVQRMQKALTGGCNALQDIIENRVKRGLVKLIFHLSELRSQVKWSRAKSDTLVGVTRRDLDTLLQYFQQLLIELEDFVRALQDTRHDFLLLFDWISERIRVHTNSLNGSGGPNGASPLTNTPAYRNEASSSVLNRRRFSEFLRRAAQIAIEFKARQQDHNRYKVETTFGNSVSNRFLAPSPKTGDAFHLDRGSAGRLFGLIDSLENAWVKLVKQVESSVAESMAKQSLELINAESSTQEFHMQLLHSQVNRDDEDQALFSPNQDTGVVEDDSDEDDGIDWDKLNSSQKTQSHHQLVLVAGFLVNPSTLLVAQRLPTQDHNSVWSTAVVKFGSSNDRLARNILVNSFGFYPSRQSGNQLAILITTKTQNEANSSINKQEVRLALVPLNQLGFQNASSIELSRNLAGIDESQAVAIELSALRSRYLDFVGEDPATSSTQLIPHGPRGIICVASNYPHRLLAIFDAEEDDEEGSEGCKSAASNDNTHPSESMEIDL